MSTTIPGISSRSWPDIHSVSEWFNKGGTQTDLTDGPLGIWATEACGLRENCEARLISSWFWEMGNWK
jgi:hypothetical protein